MSFRERLSAMAPQIGAMTPEIRKETEKTRPLQKFARDCSTPSSSMRYIGRKGMSIV